MAYETSRQVHARRDFADGGGFGETSEENPQAGRLAEKAQQLGDFSHLGVRERAKVARQGLRNDMRLHALEPTFGSSRTGGKSLIEIKVADRIIYITYPLTR